MNEARRIASDSFGWGARIALWPARVVAARAALRQLAAMDARELADIGLRAAGSSRRDGAAARRRSDALLAARAAEARIRDGRAPAVAIPRPANARPAGSARTGS